MWTQHKLVQAKRTQRSGARAAAALVYCQRHSVGDTGVSSCRPWSAPKEEQVAIKSVRSLVVPKGCKRELLQAEGCLRCSHVRPLQISTVCCSSQPVRKRHLSGFRCLWQVLTHVSSYDMRMLQVMTSWALKVRVQQASHPLFCLLSAQCRPAHLSMQGRAITSHRAVVV